MEEASKKRGLFDGSFIERPISPPSKRARPTNPGLQEHGGTISSPVSLTKIQDEPSNQQALSLTDILGDPLIKECWEFNYLHDIDFLMAAFDVDTKHLVKIHIVHGFWKREDQQRQVLEIQAQEYQNVKLHAAYLPEMFGTHHSKMILLLRHDDTAQVVIHTANMIARDWRNMTQAVWRSPLLPLLKDHQSKDDPGPVGSGRRFKRDLLNYLQAYDQNNVRRPFCEDIIAELAKHDFSAVRGSLIGSVPGRHNTLDLDETQWGWSAMKQALRAVPVQQQESSEIVVQVSSIATLGPTDAWLRNTFFAALHNAAQPSAQRPTFKVVFPTADEIRRSLDGYVSGGSIHTKIQSSQQAKQLDYLRPIFCHWANDSPAGQPLPPDAQSREAGRKRAAPHIKTYIRLTNQSTIDWALITSANLSKQAWGEVAKPSGECRISSYEIGVLVWPALFADNAIMKPSFGTDEPTVTEMEVGKTVVGFRMPYNLPLQPYAADEIPWVASQTHEEPDWKGQMWTG